MKKQILLFSMFILAVFASINSSYGQSYKTNDAKGWVKPTCGAGTEYYPEVGKPYDYKVAVANTAGYLGTGTYAWKVVTTVLPNLLTATDVGNTIYTVTGVSNAATINITWLPLSAGKNYYLVQTYSEATTDAAGKACTINNVKVFPIEPFNAFWLDINATADGGTTLAPGTDAIFSVCAPNVSVAQITTDGNLTTATVKYEYGVTTLQAVIHSAGYTGAFQGVLTLSGFQDNQSVAVTGWTAGTATAATFGNGTWTKDITTTLAGADELVTIVVTNNQHESLTDQPITIKIDGSYVVGGTTVDDMSNVGTDCSKELPSADGVVETIQARPTVNGVAPTATFVTPDPAFPLK